MKEILDKFKTELIRQTGNEGEAERLMAGLEAVKGNLPLLPDSTSIDYFRLTLSLCAAAFCVGKSPNSISMSDIRSCALSVARSLFDEEGNFLENNPNFGK